MTHLFCLGAGYCARALMARLRNSEPAWQLSATARSADAAARLQAEGITPVLLQENAPPPPLPAGVTHLLSSVPPDQQGDPLLRHLGGALAQQRPGWTGYLSTTSVYGDHQGRWVDEDTPPAPSMPRSQARVLAEQQWQQWGQDHALPVILFRLSGIYGPGRNVLDDLRQGTARRWHKDGQVFGRIFLDDIVSALIASWQHPAPEAVYNLSDDEPAPSADVTAYGAALLNLPVPPLRPLDPSVMRPLAVSFWQDNKRVANSRMHRDLLPVLTAPGYREGLQILAKDEPGWFR